MGVRGAGGSPPRSRSARWAQCARSTPAAPSVPRRGPAPGPRPRPRPRGPASGEGGGALGACARPGRARAERRRRGARGGQPAEAESRAGGRSVRREPVGTGTLPAGPGAGRAGGTWRRCDSGTLAGSGGRGPGSPATRVSGNFVPEPPPAPSGSRILRAAGKERPRALRSAPSSARGPRLAGSPCAAPAAPLLGDSPAPDAAPRAPRLASSSAPLPTPLLCGLASASPRSACARSEPREPTAAFCICRRLLVHW